MATRVAEARKDFPEVSVNVMILIAVLALRTVLFPIFDLDGVYDEVILFALLAYKMGFKKFGDFCCVLWDDWVLPKMVQMKVIDKEKMAGMKSIALEHVKSGADKKKD